MRARKIDNLLGGIAVQQDAIDAKEIKILGTKKFELLLPLLLFVHGVVIGVWLDHGQHRQIRLEAADKLFDETGGATGAVGKIDRKQYPLDEHPFHYHQSA